MLWLIPLLPLVGFLINGIFGRRLPNPVVAAIAVAGPAVGFLLSIYAFLQVNAAGTGLAEVYFTWIRAGELTVPFGFQADALSAVMLLNVTGIGTLIHVYSYGYMHEDPSFHRFMAYLNLFMTSMLILVLADNLLLMFVGWEGVGLCSYLLIGFWFEDLANVDAGRKAFVVNRVGDFAFLLGMFALFALAGGVDYATLEAHLGHADLGFLIPNGAFAGWTAGAVMTLAAVCMFIGATGKSAQIPLYVWLPDAMAGPTPVSALIHAATMVTAGVYMIGRLDFLYIHLPAVTEMIAFVAACTALLSGLIAIAQNDIKKVLAYSTVSQLGFMFVGMASTAWETGLFHVLTHAFFKALLFLGAGAVIHALHGEQDIRKMGGLWKDMKPTAILFIIGSLALAGFPGFAGFFSKDEILAAAHHNIASHGGTWPLTFAMLVLTAALTAFYTTRLVIKTFFGPPADPHRHPHANHWTMGFVLTVLAVLSLVGGLALRHSLPAFTAPVWSEAAHAAPHAAGGMDSHTVALICSLVAVALGIGSGVVLFGLKPDLVDGFVRSGVGRTLHRWSQDKFYVDELYEALVVLPISYVATLLWGVVDRIVIDRFLVEGSGRMAYGIGGTLRRTQTGALTSATVAMVVGTVAILAYMLWRVANG